MEETQTHEKIVGVGIRSTNFEEFHEIVELTVDVTANGYGTFLANPSASGDRRTLTDALFNKTYHWLHVGLILQDLSRLEINVNVSPDFGQRRSQ